MPIAGVVADADVLLSAVGGKAAFRVFTSLAVWFTWLSSTQTRWLSIFRTWPASISCRLSSWRCNGNFFRYVFTQWTSTAAGCRKRLRT